MADTQESYPTPTTGIGKALFIKLTGKNVTNANPEQASGALVGGNNTYKVTLSVANSVSAGVSATVAVTASLYDLAGTFQSIVGSVTAISYNFLPTSSSGTQESYPAPNATVGRSRFGRHGFLLWLRWSGNYYPLESGAGSSRVRVPIRWQRRRPDWRVFAPAERHGVRADSGSGRTVTKCARSGGTLSRVCRFFISER